MVSRPSSPKSRKASPKQHATNKVAEGSASNETLSSINDQNSHSLRILNHLQQHMKSHDNIVVCGDDTEYEVLDQNKEDVGNVGVLGGREQEGGEVSGGEDEKDNDDDETSRKQGILNFAGTGELEMGTDIEQIDRSKKNNNNSDKNNLINDSIIRPKSVGRSNKLAPSAERSLSAPSKGPATASPAYFQFGERGSEGKSKSFVPGGKSQKSNEDDVIHNTKNISAISSVGNRNDIEDLLVDGGDGNVGADSTTQFSLASQRTYKTESAEKRRRQHQRILDNLRQETQKNESQRNKGAVPVTTDAGDTLFYKSTKSTQHPSNFHRSNIKTSKQSNNHHQHDHNLHNHVTIKDGHDDHEALHVKRRNNTHTRRHDGKGVTDDSVPTSFEQKVQSLPPPPASPSSSSSTTHHPSSSTPPPGTICPPSTHAENCAHFPAGSVLSHLALTKRFRNSTFGLSNRVQFLNKIIAAAEAATPAARSGTGATSRIVDRQKKISGVGGDGMNVHAGWVEEEVDETTAAELRRLKSRGKLPTMMNRSVETALGLSLAGSPSEKSRILVAGQTHGRVDGRVITKRMNELNSFEATTPGFRNLKDIPQVAPISSTHSSKIRDIIALDSSDSPLSRRTPTTASLSNALSDTTKINTRYSANCEWSHQTRHVVQAHKESHFYLGEEERLANLPWRDDQQARDRRVYESKLKYFIRDKNEGQNSLLHVV